MTTEYQRLDHTADIGIQISSRGLKTLFVKAAKAMFQEILGSAKGSRHAGKKVFKIELSGANQEELMVRWLSELLSLSDAKSVVFILFKIEDITDQKLKGIAIGLPRKFYRFKTEIKAVTYHGLKISREGNRYSAQIIFDV